MDSDKGTAKFDKAKQVLTVTLPVLCPPPMEVPPILQKQLVKEMEPTVGSGSESANHDEDKRAHDVPTTNDSPESTTPDVATPTSDHAPLMEEWASIGEWCCPPFKYRQDESSITFVLNTPNVKESSFVTNFGQNFVS